MTTKNNNQKQWKNYNQHDWRQLQATIFTKVGSSSGEEQKIQSAEVKGESVTMVKIVEGGVGQ